MKTIVRSAALAIALGFALQFCGDAHAASRQQVLNRLEEFRSFFIDFQMAPDNAVPGAS